MRPPLAMRLPTVHDLAAPVLALGGLGFALLVGALVARSPAMGVAAGLAVVFIPIAFLHLPTALALWTITLFIGMIPGVGLGNTLSGLVIIAAWLGATTDRRAVMRDAFARLRGIALAVAALLLWLGLTLVWADDASAAQEQIVSWIFAAILLVIVVTTIDTPQRVRLILGAFVAGAVISVLLGVTGQNFGTAPSAIDTAMEDTEGRFAPANTDPNDLAAALVAATALAVALMAGTAGPRRLLLWISAISLVGALIATQSRGGLLAAVTAIIATIAISRGRRWQMLGVATGVVVVAVFFLASVPGALERVTSADNGGNGRTDLWRIALRMGGDHPVTGVGLNQFREHSAEYVRDPGSLKFVGLIVEDPHVVHNTYLQLFAETGIVGLALFLLVAALALSAAWRATSLFRRQGQRELQAIGQGVFVAMVGMLTASFFLSFGSSFQVWLLLGLGPALLCIARTSQPAPVPDRISR